MSFAKMSDSSEEIDKTVEGKDSTRLKIPNSEKNPKLGRTGDLLKISVTEEELEYRKTQDIVRKQYTDFVKCTKCQKDLKKENSRMVDSFEHPVLGVLMCGKCLEFYGNEEFSLDEDEEDKYCRWCGEGGKIYICSKCICGFCLKCIKRNFDRQKVKEIQQDDGWLCFLCKPKALWKLRYICHLAMQSMTKGEKIYVRKGKSIPNQTLSRYSKQTRMNDVNGSNEMPRKRGRKRKQSSKLELSPHRSSSSDISIVSSPVIKMSGYSESVGKGKKKRMTKLTKNGKCVASSDSLDSITSNDSDISSCSSRETLNESKVSSSTKKLLNKFLDILKVTETTSELCRNICRKKITKMSNVNYSNERLVQECEKVKSAIILICSSMSTAHNLLISLQQKCGVTEVNLDIAFRAKDSLLSQMWKALLEERIKKYHLVAIAKDIIRKYPHLEAATKSFCEYSRGANSEQIGIVNRCNIQTQSGESANSHKNNIHGENKNHQIEDGHRVDSAIMNSIDNCANNAGDKSRVAFFNALNLGPVHSQVEMSQIQKSASLRPFPSDISTEISLPSEFSEGGCESLVPEELSKVIEDNRYSGRNSGMVPFQGRTDSHSTSDLNKNDFEAIQSNSSKLKEQLLKSSSDGCSSDENESDTSEPRLNSTERTNKERVHENVKTKEKLVRSEEERKLNALINLKSLDRKETWKNSSEENDSESAVEVKRSSVRKKSEVIGSDIDDAPSYPDCEIDLEYPRQIQHLGSAFDFVKESSVLKNIILETSESCEDSDIESDSKSSYRKITSCEGTNETSNYSNSTESDSCNSSKSSSGVERRVYSKNKKRRMSSTESGSIATDSSSTFIGGKRRVKPVSVLKSSEESDSEPEVEYLSTSKHMSPSKRRKNIKKILKKGHLQLETRQAEEVEKERKRRMAEKNAIYNDLFPSKDERLVLDFDRETKEVLLEVPRNLAKKLKPHQKRGIKFMWDCCFESVDKLDENSGSGCILAHCMGLGKTLQVIALVFTVMRREIGVKTVLIVCPLNVVNNWMNEFDYWLKNENFEIDVYNGNNSKRLSERLYIIRNWHENGGVLIISYDLLRNLTKSSKSDKAYTTFLLDPGPDLVVCDEGHLLKNEDTALSKCIRLIKTSRRIVLTGTPFQNNLLEYHSMIQFIKPNILGTRKEFMNRFGNPIKNGQFEDSTVSDVRLMRARSHVLHKLLDGCIQRFDYSVLTPFLPEKHEYVISVPLTETQSKLYEYYLKKCCKNSSMTQHGTKLFADFHWLQKIWTHPKTLEMSAGTDEGAIDRRNRNVNHQQIQSLDEPEITVLDKLSNNMLPELDDEDYWKKVVSPAEFEDMQSSGKLVFLLDVLDRCREVGDKVLVFSQSLVNLNLIEYFLQKMDSVAETGHGPDARSRSTWVEGRDYFRMDGSTSSEYRSKYCQKFNNLNNKRARLFLISTKAGGLGINLVAANRVIIFDVSWNPSHDVQSIFRVYRFGQKKPCYIYRLLSEGTMEEKIYARQVTKLSLEKRVLDEHQIERHYTMGNLQELYRYDPTPREKWSLPNVPRDKVLAEILNSRREIIVKYHEHDSLLENKEEEELTEEERKAAWEDFEKERLLSEKTPNITNHSGSAMKTHVQPQFSLITAIHPIQKHAYMPKLSKSPMTRLPLPERPILLDNINAENVRYDNVVGYVNILKSRMERYHEEGEHLKRSVKAIESCLSGMNPEKEMTPWNRKDRATGRVEEREYDVSNHLEAEILEHPDDEEMPLSESIQDGNDKKEEESVADKLVGLQENVAPQLGEEESGEMVKQ